MSEELLFNLRRRYGLDQPLHAQYLKWVGNILQGDFGYSFQFGRPVHELIADRLGLTALISMLTLTFTYVTAIPIGILSATRQYSFADYLFMSVGFVGLATPNFLLALILMLAFFSLGVSVGGLFSPEYHQAGWSVGKMFDLAKHLPLPIIIVGTAGTAALIRVMRATLLDELARQYVITARTKGLPERRLLFKYPVRVAINPIVSTIGWLLPSIVSGSTITALVLGLPTTGPLLFRALQFQDMFLASSLLLFLNVLTLIGTFISEAPMLAALVAEDKLPPVDERLPQDVMVVRPRDAIGVYGGTLQAATVPNETSAVLSGRRQMVAIFGPDTREVVPNVVRAWELAPDFRSLTLELRRDLKWSDGEPFNTEDYVFYYEDILSDEHVTPRPARAYRMGGELATMDVLGPSTVRYSFPVAAYSALSQWSNVRPFAPEHYLKKWHPRYNDKAEEVAKSEGYDTWWEALIARHDAFNAPWGSPVPGVPSHDPWQLKELRVDAEVWERNPYYWKVDVAGNQLPYMDGVFVQQVEGARDVVPIKAMAGELDLQVAFLNIADYPIYKRNEGSGGYQTYLFENSRKGFAAGFALNYTHQDPVLRELFNDIRFRQALSLALDRDDISETLFLGLTRPHTPPVPASWTGFEDWMSGYYAEFDQARANALLDELGLAWDSANQYRLRPDGQPLVIEALWVSEWMGYFEDLMDLLKGHWAEVGIHMEPKFVAEALQYQRAMANDQDMIIVETATVSEFRARRSEPVSLMPAWHWITCCAISSVPRRQWHDSGGAEGEEPPQEIQKIFELAEAWVAERRGTERYVEPANELIRSNVEGLYYIGTVTMPPTVMMLNDRVGNMQRDAGIFAGFVYVAAIPSGIYSATHQYTVTDYAVTVVGFVGLATPNSLLA